MHWSNHQCCNFQVGQVKTVHFIKNGVKYFSIANSILYQKFMLTMISIFNQIPSLCNIILTTLGQLSTISKSIFLCILIFYFGRNFCLKNTLCIISVAIWIPCKLQVITKTFRKNKVHGKKSLKVEFQNIQFLIIF